jgi:predicted enzyme related to lactoylglutathione lyase
VDDIAAAVTKVRALGGMAEEPTESKSGWGSRCRDDQGVAFDLWQPAPGF